MTQSLVVVNYILGVALILLLGYKRRYSFLLCWPYILYGFGLLVPILFRDEPKYFFARTYFNETNLVYAAGACTLTIVLFALLDIVILRKRSFDRLLQDSSSMTSVAALAHSPAFTVVVAFTVAIFTGLYIGAWVSGEIGGEYTFRGIERLTFWGPLGFATEAICALTILYAVGQLWRRGTARRNFVIEIALVLCLVARAVPGTRMPLVKTALAVVFCIVFILRVRFRYLTLAVGILTVVYPLMSYIGFRRLGLEFDVTAANLMFPLNGEALNTNLSLLIATRNIDTQLYQPGFPIAALLYLLPSWSTDKVTLVAEFYDRDLYARSVGFDTLSPIGATHFIADAMVAYGPWFLVLVAITGIFLLSVFRGRASPVQVLLFLAILSTSHNLWRDSYLIAFKQGLEVYGFGYGALWLIAGRRPKRRYFLETRRKPDGSLTQTIITAAGPRSVRDMELG